MNNESLKPFHAFLQDAKKFRQSCRHCGQSANTEEHWPESKPDFDYETAVEACPRNTEKISKQRACDAQKDEVLVRKAATEDSKVSPGLCSERSLTISTGIAPVR